MCACFLFWLAVSNLLEIDFSNQGAHFDARNPAGPGTVGSLVQTPESLSSSRAAENSSLASQFLQWVDGQPSKPITPSSSHPSPQTVVGFIDAPPPATHQFKNCLLQTRLSLVVVC